MKVLVINPNMSRSVSALLLSNVAAACGDRARVEVVTARLGAAYIASESSYALAEHAALDAWAAAVMPPASQPDAVLIGCFGDPGLFALRECSSAPVTGLAEASFAQAAAHGRFAVVTGGAAWAPILTRLAQVTGHAAALAAIETVVPSGAELAADPQMARTVLLDACRRAARIDGVRSIIVGGAGLAGMAQQLQPAFELPLVDSVVAGAQQAMRLGGRQPAASFMLRGADWAGVSPELRQMGTP
jgi:allantoin racemase